MPAQADADRFEHGAERGIVGEFGDGFVEAEVRGGEGLVVAVVEGVPGFFEQPAGAADVGIQN